MILFEAPREATFVISIVGRCHRAHNQKVTIITLLLKITSQSTSVYHSFIATNIMGTTLTTYNLSTCF